MRTRFVLVLVLLFLQTVCVTRVVAQATPSETVRTEDLVKLQQLLATLNRFQGKSPDELMKEFERLSSLLPNAPTTTAPTPRTDPPPPLRPTPLPPNPRIAPEQMKVEPRIPQRKRNADFAMLDAAPSRRPPELATPPANLEPWKDNPELAGIAKAWEKNVGPLNDSPAVRDTLADLANAWKSGEIGGLEELMKDLKESEAFGDLLKSFQNDFDLNSLNMPDKPSRLSEFLAGSKAPNLPSASLPGPSTGPGLSFGGGGSWWPVIVLVVLAVAGLIAWKVWPQLMGTASQSPEQAVRKLGRWPVDPRTVNSREELVKAFEYLSLLMCGDAARVWNHRTIATALRTKFPSSQLIADELATLYEFARYTPPGEPLSPSSLADARRCLTQLSGGRV